ADEQEDASDQLVVNSSSSSTNNGIAKESAVQTTGGLGLLGAYTDSEDDDGADTEPQEAEPPPPKSADIDSTLANFMAEIDAITAPLPVSESTPTETPVPAPTPPRPEPKPANNHNGNEVNATVEGSDMTTDWHYDTQYSLAGVNVDMGDWQEVWDENTGCYYYWNVQTNEVMWELPHYLAAQLQGLHYQHSSVTLSADEVESNYQHTGIYHHDQTVAKPDGRNLKKKEVNESVFALATGEKEERSGVAASLLAPLIPEEVKQAEEKWRKKLICQEEEAVEEDSGRNSNSTQVQEASQEDRPSLNISLESAEEEEGVEKEEEEEYTRELELVLERKKAELRALEEGDASLTGSSPRSDCSHTLVQEGQISDSSKHVHRKGKWQALVRTLSPESTGPASDNLDRDVAPEGPPCAETSPEKPSVDAEESPVDLEGSADKQTAAPKVPPEEKDDRGELKFQIAELANTLSSKLEFLGISRQSISNFHFLLLQIETRISDWREGALNGQYLKRKLQEADLQIKHYESNASPKGWSCHWDREHRRYFYLNEQTGQSQWEFPDVDEEDETAESASRLNAGKNMFSTSAPVKEIAGALSDPAELCPQMLASMVPIPPIHQSVPAPAPPLLPVLTSVVQTPHHIPQPQVAVTQANPPLPIVPEVLPANTIAQATEKNRKVKKDKNKKSKMKMPSLVKKWQSIQRELDEDEHSSSSEDEQRVVQAHRRIEEWKQQQLVSGQAERNANFEALPEDWRERLKRRKMTSSS
ncbi:hypothetical protein scyTo_0019993, partial [Scyliorhinus torazame]|nr:hypothetical protein [Scyliorhinus torazame]